MNAIRIRTAKSLVRTAAGIMLMAGAGLLSSAASAQKFGPNGIARTETVRHEFDSKREAIQVRVDFAPGASFPKHAHPGVEIAYVLSGTVEYEMNGETIRLQAGESLYIPAGAMHSAKNVAAGVSAELATYLVEKNKPIVVLDK
ncbi:cupin domain-containing protein [Massilia pseudoviolaceinigra]|uniref:cupin domain-containing protein n=1 Tax=Massilia pseudoviolaceinigra TaxID=3057165 RepID=UPI0027969F2D|nr:cupin domain-containing protein [Massilia sp. CCM 9206]MDQ1923475.1 cupin domain-containing protein [Massilia sp. CCM 9206]